MITGDCPSEDQLVRMVEGALASDSLVGIEAHINTCELCMAVVSGLGALNEPPKVRTAVDRYQLDRKIGGGGMGEVWAAWDPKLRREVAVKLVRPDRADDGKERARLLREAQALARLTHPNVVAVHDVGEIDGEVFIATELVTGDTLASRGGASVAWKTIVGLYAQAARGLAAAHAAGLVHRDVKPSNLLVGLDGRVRVADFGLAVRAESNRVEVSPIAPTAAPGSGAGSGLTLTESGHIAGTPAYMAPEQRVGDPPEAPADQFALCVALGEAVAGRRPPIATTREAMIEFVGERRPREPGLDELCGIIARGTSFEPAERYPDMDTLAGLLEGLAGTRALTVTPPPVAGRQATSDPRQTERVRSGVRIKILVAVAALVAVGTATALYLRDKGGGAAATRGREGSLGGGDDDGLAHGGGNGVGSGGGIGVGSGLGVGSGIGDGIGSGIGVGDGIGTGIGSGVGVGGGVGNGIGTSVGIGSGVGGGVGDGIGDGIGVGSGIGLGDGIGNSVGIGSGVGVGNGGRQGANKTVRRPPPSRVAISDESTGGGPTAGGPTTAGGPATAGGTLDDVTAAIKRRDGKGCRAALARLTAPPPTDFRVASAHAVCEMLAGNCEGGIREQRALLVREGSPESAADSMADLYCPLGNDPVVRLRRLKTQITMFATSLNCDAYLPHVRAAAKSVGPSDQERMVMGGLLRAIAYCYSRREDCTTARTVLAEAQVFIPAFQLNELTAACR